MINILTDSIADIPQKLLEKYRIETLPMYVHLNGRVFRDGENINSDQLFEYVKISGQYPSTSAPPPSDFQKFFEKGEPAIFIGVSGKLSATIANAKIAVKELRTSKIDVIDSRSISIGYGQIVLQAAKWRDEGMGFLELGEKVRDLVARSRGIIILNTLDYLYHSGRCSAINHIASSVLKIRPFLQIQEDGSLSVMKKVRGSRKKAVNELYTFFKNEYNRWELSHISIGHLDCLEEANELRQKIFDLGYKKEILTTKIGCVLASHSGPKPLGIAYTIAGKILS